MGRLHRLKWEANRAKHGAIRTVATLLPPRQRQRVLASVMDARGDLHEFWRQPSPEGNDPRGYVEPVGRSQALLELVSDLPPGSRIFEVGCNVGRNLAYLHGAGFDVGGVEISPHALRLLRETYPQLADSDIRLGSAEAVLLEVPDDSYDLVFTMAVIEHIHPDSSIVFDRMARIATDVLTIEPRAHLTQRQFPHDVKGLFTARGMRQVSARPMSDFPELAGDPSSIREYVAHRFTRSPDRP